MTPFLTSVIDPLSSRLDFVSQQWLNNGFYILTSHFTRYATRNKAHFALQTHLKWYRPATTLNSYAAYCPPPHPPTYAQFNTHAHDRHLRILRPHFNPCLTPMDLNRKISLIAVSLDSICLVIDSHVGNKHLQSIVTNTKRIIVVKIDRLSSMHGLTLIKVEYRVTPMLI